MLEVMEQNNVGRTSPRPPVICHNPLKRKFAPKPPRRDQERKSGPGLATPELITKSSTANGTDKWTKGGAGSLRKKSSTRRNPLSLSHESLVVFEQDAMQQKLSSANSVNSIVHHVAKTIEQEEVGRVVGWAVSFDKLLKDPVGVDVFTEFLRGEYSEENMIFWKACEDYKKIIASNFRKSKAQEIFEQHISVRAQDCVNIDSVARKQVEGQLENPSPQCFDTAQQQIFQLMKQDSYARFLKSDLYKSYMMKEMEGKPILSNQVESSSKQKLQDKQTEKDAKKKGKGKENEDNREKRRRSLLPWRTKSKKGPKGDDKQVKQSKKEDNSIANSDINMNVKKEVAIVEVPETIAEEPEQPKFCRVIMPDGSTTVVGTKQGQTINYVLGKLLEKRSLSIATVDVFLLGSDKPLNLNDDITTLGSKEVTIERRVLFRMDLPNKKSIGVKAKPNRKIRDVFKPILNKYGYRMDAIDVHLSGQSEVLDLDSLVHTIDSQRVMVFTQPSDTPARRNGFFGLHILTSRPPLPNKLTSKRGVHGNTNVDDSSTINNHHLNNNNDIHSLDEVTNQIFGSLMLDKSDQLLLAHNFDELGILDPDTGPKEMTGAGRLSLDSLVQKRELDDTTTKESGKTAKTKQKVTFSLPKNSAQSLPSDAEEDLCERLKRAQNLRLDDQRGLAPQDLELPEFLREPLFSGRESAPAALNSQRCKSPPPQNHDLISEIDDYIENITENFAAYTRECMPYRFSGVNGGDLRTLHNFRTFGMPTLKTIDKSFSEDGILPSNEDAENLFKSSGEQEADFTDPTMTHKNLSDIGLSPEYNKYLSKSRNFVNQRPKPVSPIIVQTDAEGSSLEVYSPNQTLKSEQISDALDSTLVHSSSSSPYSSDSSLEKENLHRHSRSNVINVQPNSRHTQLHSPITASEENSSLSLVDTDGKTRHTSHAIKTPGESQPQMTKSSALTQSVGINSSHTDEVTFV